MSDEQSSVSPVDTNFRPAVAGSRSICPVLAFVFTLLGCGADNVEHSSPAASCELTPSLALTLGLADEESWVPTPTAVAETRDRFLVVDINQASEIRAYSKTDGRFTGLVGRAGDGPGEFRNIHQIRVGPADSLFVMEMGGQVDVLDPELRFARFARGPGMLMSESGGLPTGNGSILLNGQMGAYSGGQPLHVVDTAGNILRSFGRHPDDVADRGPAITDVRFFQPDASDEPWVAHPTRYVLERWSTDSGRLLTRVERSPPWFPSDAYVGNTPTLDPPPMLLSVRPFDEEQLQVIGRRAQTEPAEAKRPPAGVEEPFDLGAMDRRWDLVIELIDLGGELLGQAELPPAVGAFLSTGRFYTYREVGVVEVIEIWNLEVDCP